MATRSGGNGTNFGWLKKLCDISTCDLSPDGNPEKYGRPVKSAIVTTLVHSFLNGSSSFLQITRPTIKTWMSFSFGKIPSLTSKLASLERLKNQWIIL